MAKKKAVLSVLESPAQVANGMELLEPGSVVGSTTAHADESRRTVLVLGDDKSIERVEQLPSHPLSIVAAPVSVQAKSKPISVQLEVAGRNASGIAQAMINEVLVNLQMARHKAQIAIASGELGDDAALFKQIAEL